MTDHPYDPVLLSGLVWLYRTIQPLNALASVLGFETAVAAGRRLQFSPTAPTSLGCATVRLHSDDDDPDTGGLDAGEVQALADHLERGLHRPVGVVLGDQEGATRGAIILLDPLHPTLRAAVSRRHQPCPAHQSRYCALTGCRWLSAGMAALIRPVWPEVTADA